MVISLGPDLPLGTSTPPAEDRGESGGGKAARGPHLTTERRNTLAEHCGVFVFIQGEMKFLPPRLSITEGLQLFRGPRQRLQQPVWQIVYE